MSRKRKEMDFTPWPFLGINVNNPLEEYFNVSGDLIKGNHINL